MKIFYVIIGFTCVILGAIGVIIPILPTTPFLLLASFCLAKGSKRFNGWFISTNLYKKHIDDFVQNRTMKLSSKIGLLMFASIMLLIAFFIMNNIYGKIFIAFLIIFKYYYFIFRIKTI